MDMFTAEDMDASFIYPAIAYCDDFILEHTTIIKPNPFFSLDMRSDEYLNKSHLIFRSP